jgi:glyoxalase family protein
LSQQGIRPADGGERFGERVLAFVDPDGLPLELAVTREVDPSLAWRGGPVDSGHAIGGFHSATLSEEGYEQTARLLGDTMGFTFVGSEGNRLR